MIDRRQLLRSLALFTGAAPAARVEIPVLRLIDKYSRRKPADIELFPVWREAVAVFAKGGIVLDAAERTGEVLKYPSGRPLFRGLDHGKINLVLTDRVPLDWDEGRSLAGVSAVYENYCVSVISMDESHGNRIPFLSTNTIVHELLHVLLGDVFVPRTGILKGQTSEVRVDTCATLLWLFGDSSAIRAAAPGCLRHLRGLANPGLVVGA